MRRLTGKHLYSFCLLTIVSMGLSVGVSAHNVVSGVYADGMMIEGEIGFSNGDMAQAGSLVNVYDAQGGLLAELTLVDGGIFTYQAKSQAKHVFKADLSAGHVAEMVIEADELTQPVIASGQTSAATKKTDKLLTKTIVDGSLEAQASSASDKADLKQGSDIDGLGSSLVVGSGGHISIAQLESIVRSAVAQQVRPLQKELRAYKEKVMFRDITGGLGFIFGLFGVAAWMASKRKQGEKNAPVS